MDEHRFRATRSARYYTLGTPGPGIRDAWIVCHGYGQLARDFLAGFEPIAAPGRLIAAPEALSRFYLAGADGRPGSKSRVGAAWMTREDRLAEIGDTVALLDGIAGELVPQLGPGVRLRALGFSQGTPAVTRWVALGRHRPADLILWAGEVPGDLDDSVLAERLAGLQVHLVAGTHDRLVPAALVEHQERRLRAAGVGLTMHRFDGGHRLDTPLLEALAAG